MRGENQVKKVSARELTRKLNLDGARSEAFTGMVALRCFILITLLKSDARARSHVHLLTQSSEGRVKRVPIVRNRRKSQGLV
jgi:hypothetical protein